MAAEASLSVLVAPLGEAFELEEPVAVRLILVNDGADPLVVNRRMLVNSEHALPDVREVVFEIAGPPGYASVLDTHVNARAAGAEHFAELAPGASVEKEVALTDYHSLHVAGVYRLRATYANVVDPPGLSQPAWRGSVTSPWVRFERVG